MTEDTCTQDLCKVIPSEGLQRRQSLSLRGNLIYGLDKKWFRQFDCVIGDECHNFKAKSLQWHYEQDVQMLNGDMGSLVHSTVRTFNKLILEGLLRSCLQDNLLCSDLMEKGFLAKLNGR